MVLVLVEVLSFDDEWGMYWLLELFRNGNTVSVFSLGTVTVGVAAAGDIKFAASAEV